MNVKTVKHAILALVVAGSAILTASGQIGGALPSARADASCQAMLQPYVTWVSQDPIHHLVEVQAASQNADQTNQFVSYADGSLYAQYGGSPLRYIVGITGTATQYFSDRTTTIGPGLGTTQPFSALRTDSLGVQVSTTGSTMFTLNSWGGGQFTLSNPLCANGVLYGFSNTSPAALFALSFTQRSSYPPR